MARDEDCNGIGAIGRADGTCRLGVADALRQVLIAQRVAVGDGLQLRPDRLLKRGAGGAQRQIKCPACAVKILIQLCAGVAQAVAVAGGVLGIKMCRDASIQRFAPVTVAPVTENQGVIHCAQQQFAVGSVIGFGDDDVQCHLPVAVRVKHPLSGGQSVVFGGDATAYDAVVPIDPCDQARLALAVCHRPAGAASVAPFVPAPRADAPSRSASSVA